MIAKLEFLEVYGFNLAMVFDAEVYFLTMVVGVVLPPGHGDLQMFLDQLSDSSSVFG